MAEEREEQHGQENRTEEPSERRKEKARAEGIIAYSREVGTTLGFMAVSLTVYFCGAGLYENFRSQATLILSSLDAWAYGGVPTGDVILPALAPIAVFTAGLLFASFLAPVAGHILQKGTEPRFEAAAPRWDRMSPAAGLKQLLSAEAAAVFTKNIVKTLGLMAIFYLTIAPYLDRILTIAVLPFEPAVALIGVVVGKFLVWATVFMAGVAGLDYFVNWRRVHRKLMMTRHELKEELKDVEGNPQIRQRVRHIQQERARRQLKKTVPKATVVVTNPTHFAVALRYKKGETAVPVLLAKGADILARRIKEIARESRVPVVENPLLARAIYREVKVGKEIPFRFYKTVARIIAAILKLEEEKKRQIMANYHVYRATGS